MNNFGRCPLGDATYPNMQALCLVVSDKIFPCFPYISLCKTCDPCGGAILPKEHNLNKLGRGLIDDASYLVVSDNIFFMFSLYKPM